MASPSSRGPNNVDQIRSQEEASPYPSKAQEKGEEALSYSNYELARERLMRNARLSQYRTERERKQFEKTVSRGLFIAFVMSLGLALLFGCSTPNYGGVCTVNARLMGEC